MSIDFDEDLATPPSSPPPSFGGNNLFSPLPPNDAKHERKVKEYERRYENFFEKFEGILKKANPENTWGEMNLDLSQNFFVPIVNRRGSRHKAAFDVLANVVMHNNHREMYEDAVKNIVKGDSDIIGFDGIIQDIRRESNDDVESAKDYILDLWEKFTSSEFKSEHKELDVVINDYQNPEDKMDEVYMNQANGLVRQIGEHVGSM